MSRAEEFANKIGALDPNAPQLGELRDQIAMARENANNEAEAEQVAALQPQHQPAPRKNTKTAAKAVASVKLPLEGLGVVFLVTFSKSNIDSYSGSYYVQIVPKRT